MYQFNNEHPFEVFIDGQSFKDEYGRQLIFRGVNLAAKVPSKPDGSTYLKNEFKKHREVSFVDRPFPLVEADEHFARLKYWGFTLIRLSTSWEAIEHAGPGVYDEEYLVYLEKIVQKASMYGFKIFIDFHQDVWSRFTGGDGAPGWTLEAAGFQIDQLEETGATILHNPMHHKPHILWPTNGYKLGAATMFTLFFGGNLFAPNKMVGDKQIEDFLQDAYINSIKIVVERLKSYSAVIGYDIMNEPLTGYIGCNDLSKNFGIFKLGATPTPFQGMVLGDGNSDIVNVWQQKNLAIRKTGQIEINSQKKSAWQLNSSCIWKDHGVWDYNDNGEPTLLRPKYFKNYVFEEEFYKPFINKAGKAIQSISPKSILLIEHVIGSAPPKWGSLDLTNVVFSSHWYDAVLLATKRFFKFFGFDMHKMKKIIKSPKWMRKAFAKQIEHLKNFAKEHMGNIPLIITEFGIPVDLEGKRAYRTGNFSIQDKALHRSFLAIDDNLTSSILWNYTGNNSNFHGDHWNEEDLSIFSKDQKKSSTCPYSGARGKNAFIRPYPIKTAGNPLKLHFQMEKRSFEYHFEHDKTSSNHPTEIFLPDLHFGNGFTIEISDGSYEVDKNNQILSYYHTENLSSHFIKIKALGRREGPMDQVKQGGDLGV